MEPDKAFLDDTSISKTPRSPIQASTAAKDISKRPPSIVQPKNAPSIMNSFLSQDTNQALNEVTNIPNFAVPKLKLDKTFDSITTDANSSLGILPMDNFCDVSDNSLSLPEKSVKSKKKSKKAKVLSKPNTEGLKTKNMFLSHVGKMNAVDEEDDNCSSSDIEFDGTNIPELNYECNITVENENLQGSNFDEKLSRASEFLQSFDADGGTTVAPRHSIFESMEPSYKTLFNQLITSEPLEDSQLKSTKTAHSSEIDFILSQDVLDEEYFIQNIKKLSSTQITSTDFCPEEISARSSSLKSSSDKVADFSDSVENNSVFQKTVNNESQEDLKDEIVTKDWLAKFKDACSFQETKCYDGDSKNSSFLPERDVSSSDIATNLSYNNFGAAKFCDASNFLSSSALGISESEFKKSDEAIELFQKNEEDLKKEHMFEITDISSSGDFSKDSLATQKDVSTASWVFENQSNIVPERQISFGTLFSARTENLGTLSEDSSRERPYFGITVSTPTKTFLNSLTTSIANLPSESIASASSLGTSKSVLSSKKKSNKTEFFRESMLSDMFDEASVLRPSRLASEIYKQIVPLQKQCILNENNVEIHNLLHTKSQSPENLQNDANIPIAVSPSLNNSTLELQSEKENPILSEISLSNTDTISGKNNINVKYDACPNCQFSFPNQAGSTRPSSSCSSSCSSIPIPNALCNRHPTSASAQNIFPGVNNCHHNGLFFNTCAMFGAIPTQPMNFPSQQPFVSCLPGCNFCHVSGSNSLNAVLGPDELQYPEKISMYDTQHFKLSVRNTQNMPCLYQIYCLSAIMNEHPVSFDLSGISFPGIVKCSNGNSTDIEVTLCPKFEGKFQVELQITACLSPADLTFSSFTFTPLKTVIKYESIRPTVSLSSKGDCNLNMGSIIAGSTVTEYVTIENTSEVSVPVSLYLSSDMNDHHIYFGINQMKLRIGGTFNDLRFLSPKVMYYRLSPPQTNSVSHLEIPVIFEAGENNADVTFTLTASIENQNLKEALAFLNVSASVRKVELILTDPSLNPLHFHIRSGRDVTQKSLTVKNQGSFPVTYDLLIENSDSFSVSPTSLSLQPMEKSAIFITFRSSGNEEVKGLLKAAAQPHGKVYNIADLVASEQRLNNQNGRHSLPRLPEQSVRDKNKATDSKNFIEVNKKNLAWGGVDIGSTVIKTFSMRNILPKFMQIRLFVKEASQSFQILNQNNEKSQSLILDLAPKEEKLISLAFSPERVVLCSGFLLLRTICENRKMFSIPLSGYGGIGKLKIQGVPEKEGVGYCLDVSAHNENVTYNSISVKNTEHRAIFVKVIVSNSGAENSLSQVSVHPSEIVLLENETKILFVSSLFSKHSLAWSSSNLGMITLMYGDEIMRQQLKKHVFKNGSQEGLSADVHNHKNFTCHYDGEERVQCDSTYPNTPKDVSLFNSNLKKILIHLNPIDQSQSYSHMNFDALSTIENSHASLFGEFTSHTSRRYTAFRDCHSPPEKEFSDERLCRLSMPQQLFQSGTQSTHSEEGNSTVKEKKKNECWTVKPAEMTLDLNNKDNRVALINHSKQDLKFRIECAVDVISVSPVSGILTAKGEIGLRMTIIPYSHNKLSTDYHGHLKIFCGGIEKSVLVKVPQDQKRQKDAACPSHDSNLNIEPTFTEDTLTDENMIHPINDVPSRPTITVFNLIDFPKEIAVNNALLTETSKTPIMIQNTADSAADWKIQSTSIVFSDMLENSLWMPRIFEFSPSSGVLGSKETCTLEIKFCPPNLDNYSQFFELSFNTENNLNQKCNFKVNGKGALDASQESKKVIPAAVNDTTASTVFKKPKVGVYLDSDIIEFPSTTPGQTVTNFVTLKNNSSKEIKINIIKPKLPFVIKHSSVLIKSKRFLKIPVHFKPTESINFYEENLIFHTESDEDLVVKLRGLCLS